MISVELDIFSGRPNPTWTLSDKEERELLDRLRAQPGLAQPVDSGPSHLGYRGFIVTPKDDAGQSIRVAGLPSTFRLGGAGGDGVAKWLIGTSEKPNVQVDDPLRDEVVRPSGGPPATAPAGQPSGAAQGGVEAEGAWLRCARNHLTSNSDFSFWNHPNVVRRNNCYNFGSNYRTNTFAQPGRISTPPVLRSTYRVTRFDCSVANLVRRDGWRDGCLGGAAQSITICLVIWPGRDFHFYRMCAGGWWCHKAGQTPARNTDNSGRFIASPLTCNRGPYTSVCGFFYTDKFKLVI